MANDVTDSDLDGTADGEEGLVDDKGQRLVPASKVSETISKRVNEVTARFAEKEAALQRQIDELKAQSNPANKPAPVYTREQLTAAVEAGKMTQAQANTVWDRQQQRLITETAANTAADLVNKTQREARLQSTIDKYAEKFPDILKPGTADRQKVAEEVAVQQRDFGLQGIDAEVAALRVVFGRENTLRFDTKERDRRGHEDTMGGSGGSGSGDADPDMPKDLTPRERKYYQDRIERGLYKGWKDVKEELKYVNTDQRKRRAARA